MPSQLVEINLSRGTLTATVSQPIANQVARQIRNDQDYRLEMAMDIEVVQDGEAAEVRYEGAEPFDALDYLVPVLEYACIFSLPKKKTAS